MPMLGVHHVSLNVHDADAVRDFYVDVLGLQPLARPDFGFPGHWLEQGGQQIHLIEVKDHEPANASPLGPHFAFQVRDLDSVRAEIEAKGVEVSKPFEIPGVGRQCFLHDPAGNVIELNEPLAP